MNLIGKWKVKEVLSFSPEKGMEWITVDEIVKAADDPESIAMYRDTVTVFNEDGTVETFMHLPEGCTQEQIDAAIAEGTVIRDGMIVMETKQWKTEDGKNLYNTENQGEILGEEVSPWVEIKEVGDMIEIELLRYVRAE